MICRHHELPFGAELVSGGVRFRLWAPRAHSAVLELADAVLPMNREAGWFALITDRAGAGARYRYIVDGTAYPDPASRRQPDGVHGASEVVVPAAYRWTEIGWRGRPWEEIVLYELHLGTFSETGDFAGATRHLDHIRALGYDGTYPYAPSSRYGWPEDLKRLVEACHARGLAIVLDVVYNHFGPDGNYLPAIAPDFFTDRYQTPWGAALDFSGPHSRPVRDFMIHNALYWLEEYDFDGLRLDAVHAIHDGSEPDILTEIAQTVRRQITDREIHLILENDRNEARYLTPTAGRAGCYTAQWNDDLHHALHVLITGEDAGYYADYAAQPVAHLGRALAEGFGYQGEASPFRGGKPRGEPSSGLSATALSTFEMSRLDWAEPTQQAHAGWLARYRRLLAIRQHEIVPRLRGMAGSAGSYRVLGAKSVVVEWRLGDASRLRLIANFDTNPLPAPELSEGGRMLYTSAETPGAPESATFVLLPA